MKTRKELLEKIHDIHDSLTTLLGEMVECNAPGDAIDCIEEAQMYCIDAIHELIAEEENQ